MRHKTKILTSQEPVDCDENRCGEKELIYAPGVGLVKFSFVHRDGSIDMGQLTECEISDENEDYFPLDPGNRWTYEWADKEGVFPSTDIYEVIGAADDRYYLSHYYYALKRVKA